MRQEQAAGHAGLEVTGGWGGVGCVLMWDTILRVHLFGHLEVERTSRRAVAVENKRQAAA